MPSLNEVLSSAVSVYRQPFITAALLALPLTVMAQVSSSTSEGLFNGTTSTTTTMGGGESMSQSTQLNQPIGNDGGYVYGGSNTSVTGGSNLGGQGQPVSDNTTGSQTTTTYGVGIGTTFP